MEVMPLPEAWAVLGLDFGVLMADLKARQKVSERVEAAEGLLSRAGSISRRLMAKHHPDRGGNVAEFIKVKQALESIEFHTNNLVGEFEKISSQPQKERDIFIQIG